jgi:hypothetical protein
MPTFTAAQVLNREWLDRIASNMDFINANAAYSSEPFKYQDFTDAAPFVGYVLHKADLLYYDVTCTVGTGTIVVKDPTGATKGTINLINGNNVGSQNTSGWALGVGNTYSVTVTSSAGGNGTIRSLYESVGTPSVTSPAFADGAVSAASDFNDVCTSLTNLYDAVMMPKIGSQGVLSFAVPDTVESYAWRSRIRHVSTDINLYTGAYQRSADGGGDLTIRIYYGGVLIRSYTGVDDVWTYDDVTIDLSTAFPAETFTATDGTTNVGGPVVGKMYQMDVTTQNSQAAGQQARASVFYCFEVGGQPPGTYTTPPRFVYGDYGIGDGGGKQFKTLADNLDDLQSRIAGFWNPISAVGGGWYFLHQRDILHYAHNSAYAVLKYGGDPSNPTNSYSLPVAVWSSDISVGVLDLRNISDLAYGDYYVITFTEGDSSLLYYAFEDVV